MTTATATETATGAAMTTIAARGSASTRTTTTTRDNDAGTDGRRLCFGEDSSNLYYCQLEVGWWVSPAPLDSSETFNPATLEGKGACLVKASRESARLRNPGLTPSELSWLLAMRGDLCYSAFFRRRHPVHMATRVSPCNVLPLPKVGALYHSS